MKKMLACEKIKPLLSAYFDNELLPEDSLKVNEHLCSCSQCNNELQSIKKLSKLLKDFIARERNQIPTYSNGVFSRLCAENPIYCEKVIEQVDNYFKGNVDLKLHYLIHEHLDNCPDCQHIYNNFEF